MCPALQTLHAAAISACYTAQRRAALVSGPRYFPSSLACGLYACGQPLRDAHFDGHTERTLADIRCTQHHSHHHHCAASAGLILRLGARALRRPSKNPTRRNTTDTGAMRQGNQPAFKQAPRQDAARLLSNYKQLGTPPHGSALEKPALRPALCSLTHTPWPLRPRALAQRVQPRQQQETAASSFPHAARAAVAAARTMRLWRCRGLMLRVRSGLPAHFKGKEGRPADSRPACPAASLPDTECSSSCKRRGGRRASQKQRTSAPKSAPGRRRARGVAVARPPRPAPVPAQAALRRHQRRVLGRVAGAVVAAAERRPARARARDVRRSRPSALVKDASQSARKWILP